MSAVLRNSLGRTTAAVGSKAQEMLGLGPNSKVRILQVQRQGFLLKKPFSRGGQGSWQRKYFVLKDSFLFWYAAKPSVAFDMKPVGCLPLGGCSVFPMGKEKDGGFVFEVSHPDFNGAVLQLKSKDKAEVDDWIKVLQDCSKASWQNAMLGDALVQKLKHQGTALEKETERALNEARVNAEEFSSIRQEKLKAMEEQLDRQRVMEQELLSQKLKAAELEKEVAERGSVLEQKRKEQEAEQERCALMQSRLHDAYKAIQQLEGALGRRQGAAAASNPMITQHIAVIKKFMEGSDALPGGHADAEEADSDDDVKQQSEDDA
jgi:hypothetical protein